MWDPAPPASCRHRRDPPIPRRLGFRRCEDAPGPLVQMGPEGRIAGANRGDVDHPLGVAPAATKRNPTSPDDPLPDSLIRGGALSPANRFVRVSRLPLASARRRGPQRYSIRLGWRTWWIQVVVATGPV